jgi:hypothetical protein
MSGGTIGEKDGRIKEAVGASQAQLFECFLLLLLFQ